MKVEWVVSVDRTLLWRSHRRVSFIAAGEELAAGHRKKAKTKLNVRETSKGKPYPLNLPKTTYSTVMALHADRRARDFVWKIRRFSHTFSNGRSGMKGVSVRSRKGGGTWYEAKISQTSPDGTKRTFDLGKLECEDGRMYD